MGDREYDVLYITTVIVGKKYWRKGVSTAMYEKLMQEFPNREFLIRTWSENRGSGRLLRNWGSSFLSASRTTGGKGMDTVYYEKRRSTL